MGIFFTFDFIKFLLTQKSSAKVDVTRSPAVLVYGLCWACSSLPLQAGLTACWTCNDYSSLHLLAVWIGYCRHSDYSSLPLPAVSTACCKRSDYSSLSLLTLLTICCTHTDYNSLPLPAVLTACCTRSDLNSLPLWSVSTDCCRHIDYSSLPLPAVLMACCTRSDSWHCWSSVLTPRPSTSGCPSAAWMVTGSAAVPTRVPGLYSPLSSVSLICCHSTGKALYCRGKFVKVLGMNSSFSCIQ